MDNHKLAKLVEKALIRIEADGQSRSIFAEGMVSWGGYIQPAGDGDSESDDWVITLTTEVFANAPIDDAGEINFDALAWDIAHDLSHYRRNY